MSLLNDGRSRSRVFIKSKSLLVGAVEDPRGAASDLFFYKDPGTDGTEVPGFKELVNLKIVQDVFARNGA